MFQKMIYLVKIFCFWNSHVSLLSLSGSLLSHNFISVQLFSEKSFSDSFQIERNTIVVTVFHLIVNPTEVRLVPQHRFSECREIFSKTW